MQPAENWQTIRPTKGWQMIDLGELARYRDLLYFLTVRGIKARYAQSVLGVGWAIIQPLFSTLVFTVVFGNLARVNSDGIPYALFSFLGLAPWTYFSSTLNESANSLVQNAGLITKVYFPRLVLPLSAALSKLLDFAISLSILVFFMIYFQTAPGWGILALPLLILILLTTSLGLGMILSAMSVQFRDVKHALSFVVQLLMYAAPRGIFHFGRTPGLALLVQPQPHGGRHRRLQSRFPRSPPFPGTSSGPAQP
jgi:lipopolysaccharide transport system permease protein